MSEEQLILLLLIAHVLTDFSFQTERLATGKRIGGWHSRELFVHIVILFVFTFGLSLHFSFLPAALLISVMHYFTDLMKPKVVGLPVIGKWAFFIDQAIHVFTIIGVVHLFGPYNTVTTWIDVPENSDLRLGLSVLLCGRVSYFFIGELFKSLDISIRPKEVDHRRKRSWLGTIERVMIVFALAYGYAMFIAPIMIGMVSLRFLLYKKRKKAFILLEASMSLIMALAIHKVVICF